MSRRRRLGAVALAALLLGLAAAGQFLLWALAFLFVYWTFRPPHLGLGQDPVTGGYGIP